jgi:hypothetical protein
MISFDTFFGIPPWSDLLRQAEERGFELGRRGSSRRFLEIEYQRAPSELRQAALRGFLEGAKVAYWEKINEEEKKQAESMFSTEDLNRTLDRLRVGMDDGRRFGPAAEERAAWRVLKEICPAQSEEQCRKLIDAWVRTGVITIGEYYDPKEQKEKRMASPARKWPASAISRF